MPSLRIPYRNMYAVRVNWCESDWRPEECHACGYAFDHENPPNVFYDVQRSNGVIVNEDNGYCSVICCEHEIDRMIQNGEIPNFENLDGDTQEEETED